MGCNLQYFANRKCQLYPIYLQTGNVYYIDKPRMGEIPSGALKTYGSGKDF